MFDEDEPGNVSAIVEVTAGQSSVENSGGWNWVDGWPIRCYCEDSSKISWVEKSQLEIVSMVLQWPHSRPSCRPIITAWFFGCILATLAMIHICLRLWIAAFGWLVFKICCSSASSDTRSNLMIGLSNCRSLLPATHVAQTLWRFKAEQEAKSRQQQASRPYITPERPSRMPPIGPSSPSTGPPQPTTSPSTPVTSYSPIPSRLSVSSVAKRSPPQIPPAGSQLSTAASPDVLPARPPWETLPPQTPPPGRDSAGLPSTR